MASMFSLREFGTTFATRGRGAELRQLVLTRGVGTRAMVIDFTDVTNVSYSFADEFIGRLVAEHHHQLELELTNMIETVERTVDGALRRRLGEVAC